MCLIITQVFLSSWTQVPNIYSAYLFSLLWSLNFFFEEILIQWLQKISIKKKKNNLKSSWFKPFKNYKEESANIHVRHLQQNQICKKNSYRRLLLCNFLAKTLKLNKIPMTSFPNCYSKSTAGLVQYGWYKKARL